MNSGDLTTLENAFKSRPSSLVVFFERHCGKCEMGYDSREVSQLTCSQMKGLKMGVTQFNVLRDTAMELRLDTCTLETDAVMMKTSVIRSDLPA